MLTELLLFRSNGVSARQRVRCNICVPPVREVLLFEFAASKSKNLVNRSYAHNNVT